MDVAIANLGNVPVQGVERNSLDVAIESAAHGQVAIAQQLFGDIRSEVGSGKSRRAADAVTADIGGHRVGRASTDPDRRPLLARHDARSAP